MLATFGKAVNRYRNSKAQHSLTADLEAVYDLLHLRCEELLAVQLPRQGEASGSLNSSSSPSSFTSNKKGGLVFPWSLRAVTDGTGTIQEFAEQERHS